MLLRKTNNLGSTSGINRDAEETPKDILKEVGEGGKESGLSVGVIKSGHLDHPPDARGEELVVHHPCSQLAPLIP